MQFYSGRLLIKMWLVQYRKSQLLDWGMFLVLCGSTREDYLPRCDQSNTPNFNCFTTKVGRSWIIHLELKYTSSSTFPFLYWYVAELVSCIFIILILNTVVICIFPKPEFLTQLNDSFLVISTEMKVLKHLSRLLYWTIFWIQNGKVPIWVLSTQEIDANREVF